MEILRYVEAVLAVAGALTAAAEVIARLTPNKTDDHWVAVVQGLLARAGSLFLKPGAKQ